MDNRLAKALEFGNYMVTLNNQKRLLKEKFLDQSVHYVDGHKFEITKELITYCKTLIDLGHTTDVVVVDSLDAPYRVPDLNQFKMVSVSFFLSSGDLLDIGMDPILLNLSGKSSSTGEILFWRIQSKADSISLALS